MRGGGAGFLSWDWEKEGREEGGEGGKEKRGEGSARAIKITKNKTPTDTRTQQLYSNYTQSTLFF